MLSGWTPLGNAVIGGVDDDLTVAVDVGVPAMIPLGKAAAARFPRW